MKWMKKKTNNKLQNMKKYEYKKTEKKNYWYYIISKMHKKWEKMNIRKILKTEKKKTNIMLYKNMDKKNIKNWRYEKNNMNLMKKCIKNEKIWV